MNNIVGTIENKSEQIDQYDKVERWCKDHINDGSDFIYDPILFQTIMKSTSLHFNFPLESLISFFRTHHTKYIKSKAYKVRNNCRTKHIRDYSDGKSILDLAKEENYSPTLLARLILEEVIDKDVQKTKINNMLKNPLEELKNIGIIKPEFRESEYQRRYLHLIDGKERSSSLITTIESETEIEIEAESKTMTRLAVEVKEAVDSDPLYGPASDRAKHFIGIEYEIILEHGLKNLGVPFESEAQLRAKGSAKTPDVVLSSPIGFKVGTEWMVVCWIDSKALYGDADTHQNSVVPQAKSYIHRFGPGMICYWFGHAPLSKLENINGDLVIAGWKLPETILWPDG